MGPCRYQVSKDDPRLSSLLLAVLWLKIGGRIITEDDHIFSSTILAFYLAKKRAKKKNPTQIRQKEKKNFPEVSPP